MHVTLEGQVVVVTGAASGIGAAIARAAAESGAAVLLTDRDGPGLATMAETIPGAATCEADLLDPEAPERIAAAARDRFGRIDGLANAAGLTDRASLADGDPAAWDRLFAVNARAPFFLMQAAVADMRRRGAGGAIVNILSVNAHCGQPDLAIYSGSKGALMTLTRNAAHAHMADRIRVNGIALGWALTPTEDRIQSVVLGRGPGWLAEEAARRPLGRLIAPEEVARLTVFLLSPASVPMSGAILDFEQKVTGAPG